MNKPIDDNYEINTIETTENQQIETEKDGIEEPSALTTSSAKTTTITTDTAPREKNDNNNNNNTTDDLLLALNNNQQLPVIGGNKIENLENINNKEKREEAPNSPTDGKNNEIQNADNTAGHIEDNQQQHHKTSEVKDGSESLVGGSGEKNTEDAQQLQIQREEGTFDDKTVSPIQEKNTTLQGKGHEVTPFFIDHEAFAEKVPGSLQQEVGLLPRILERLQAGPEAFISDATLFELYAIANILTRLDGCSLLKGTEIAKLVTAVKKLFAFNIRCACPALAEEEADESEQQVETKEEKREENDTTQHTNDSHQEAQRDGHYNTHLATPQNECPRQSQKQNQQQHPCGKKKGGGKHKNRKHKNKKQSQLSAALRNVNEAAMRNNSKLGTSDGEKEEEENEASVSGDSDNDDHKGTCINNGNDNIDGLAEKSRPATESEPTARKVLPCPQSKDALAINRLLSYFREGWHAQKKKRYLSAYNQLRSITKDPQETMRDIPTRTTGMRSENESNGEGIIHYTIYSLEESGYGEDETVTRALHESEEKHRHLLKQLGGDHSRENPKPTAQPQAEQNVSQNTLGFGKRLAFLVGPRGISEEVGREAANTHMAELSILAEILSSSRYGFEVHTTLVSNDLCPEEVEDEIVDTISRTIGEEAAEKDGDSGICKSPYIDQILVYLFTPDAVKINPHTGMPLPQYSLSFSSSDDNNHQSLSHRSILNAINAACVGGDIIHDENNNPAALTPCCVGHVQIVHDVGHSLQSLAAAVALPPHEQSLEIGHHVALTLTEAAKSIANTSRMWLFDGLFTPLMCEMLTVARDDAAEIGDALGEGKTKNQKRYICPEDFVNYATISLGYKDDDDEDDIEEIEVDSSSDRNNDDEDSEKGKKDKTAPRRTYLPAVGRSVILSDRTLSAPLL